MNLEKSDDLNQEVAVVKKKKKDSAKLDYFADIYFKEKEKEKSLLSEL
jgi:hypothetical protein